MLAEGMKVETTPSNPQLMTGEQQTEMQGLNDGEKAKLVEEIILPYRTQWSADRLLRMPYWLKNTEFDKGRQILSWDQATGTWFDSIAWYRQNGGDDEDCTYLEKYINNITQMLRKSYVAAVARGIPPVIVRPENAKNLSDSTTAKAAQELISIIERMNRSKAMVRSEAMKLYLYGVYFKWTRFVMDGTWAGTRPVPIMGEKTVVMPGHMHCKGCGVDTVEDQAGPNCECGRDYTDADFYPSEPVVIPSVIGTGEQDRGMVKWSVFSPLNVDTDPTATNITHVPLLALDYETDVAELRATFPEDMDKITEGLESSTDPNNSYSRLVRTRVYTQSQGQAASTGDIFAQRVTFTQVWIQPRTFYKCQDKAFVAKMRQMYPKGCKVSMCGPTVLAIVKASLPKEWSCCRLDEEYGMYPPAIADNVVPFNERFNNSSNIIDDWFERCSTGMVFADPNKVDMTQMDGKSMVGGGITPLPSKGQGMEKPLAESIWQFQFRFEPSVFNYQDRLINFCQLLSGVPPQVFGAGTTEGVETAKGQKQMLDQALGKLGVDWSLIKEEHAIAAQNAVECAQQNKKLMGEVWNVIGENGSEFRNNYVHLDELNGNVRVYEQVDDGLPMSPEQEREWWQNMMDNAEKNPIAQAFMDEPTNQETAAARTGVRDAVVPGAAQRAKTLQDIYTLLSSAPTPQVDPATGAQKIGDDGEPMWSPSIAPDKWMEDYPKLKKTMYAYAAENSDVKKTNPKGWLNFISYFQLACEYEVEVESYKAGNALKIHQAGAPKPPQADPNMQAAKADLLATAKGEVDRLHELSLLPPLGQNGSISGQVSAGGKILDLAKAVATE